MMPIWCIVLAILLFCSCKTSKEAIKGNTISYSEELKSQSYLIKGIREKTLNNPEDAIDNFEKATGINPRNDAAYYEMSRFAYEDKEFTKALYLIVMALDSDPDNHWYLGLKTKILKKLNDTGALILHYTKLCSLSPDNTDYQIELANQLIKIGEFKKALARLNRIETISGITSKISLQKIKLYEYLKDENSIYDEVNKLINAFPEEIYYRIQLAEAYLKFKKLQKAKDIYEKISLDFPDQKALWLDMAQIAWGEKDYSGYYEYLLKAFASPAVNLDLKIKHTFNYFSLLDKKPLFNEHAIALSKLITEVHPEEAKGFALYGDILYNTGNLKKAKIQYERSLELHQGVFSVWHQLLAIQFELKEYKEMIITSERALSFFPNQGILFYLKSLSLIQMEQFKDARPVINKGIDLTLNNDFLKAELWANLGEVYYRLNDYNRSDSAFNRSIEIDSMNSVILNNYSFYLSERNENLQLALSLIKKAVKIKPDQSSFEDSFAWILYKLTKYEDAKVWIEKAIKNGGDKSAVIIDHYGDILFRLDMKEDALKAWVNAKELGLDSEIIDKKIRDKKIYE